MKIHSFIKRTAAITLSAGLLLSSANTPFIPYANAANIKAEDVLASLTSEQRKALNKLEMTDNVGLQGFKMEELKKDKEISVIVQFKSKPGKVAVLDANVKGKKLSKKQADDQVEKEHAQFNKDIQSILPSTNLRSKKTGHKITSTFKTVYNGVAMKLPANQVEQLLQSKVVKAVYKNVELKVDPIAMGEKSAPGTSVESIPYLKIDQLHNEGITGKGIKVGVLDTGIDYNHPDLKDAYKGGYDLVDQDNDPMEATYKDWQASGQPEFSWSGSSYYTSHGTHVAGTIAGQGTNAEVSVKGVAPDVDLYAYRVLGPYGSGSSEGVIAGIEKAVNDGMDVINLSLGSDINDPYDPTSTAINYAVLNDVTAVVAAGNAGSDDYTLGSPGSAALALTVGASDVPMAVSTFNGKIGNKDSIELVSLGRHYSDHLKEWEGKSYEVVNVGLGNGSDYSGKDVKGKIALVERGEFALAEKVSNAKQNGAAAVLLYNNVEGQINANLGESVDFVPAFSLTKEAGESIKAQIQAGEANFTFSKYADKQTEGDHLADFSSRGPARETYDMKPEVIAPGVSVLSTVPSYMVDAEHQENYQYAYSRYSGTSMATPHTAGIAALMLQANPQLEPEDIKTVLMNTADPLNGDYSVFEVGAGRVDPYQAVYSGTSFKINDKTFVPGAEELIKVKELTGGLSFDVHYADKKLNLKKSITIENHDKVNKTFNVSVTESNGSNSLKENGVELDIRSKISVKSEDFKKVTPRLLIPKKAKDGIYEGYITLTNYANSSEQYRIPFSFRTMEDGFNKVGLLNPAFSPGHLNQVAWDPMRTPFVVADFNLRAPMEKMDVVLQDGKTGKDLGLVGTINLDYAYDNVDYGLYAFNGAYYEFTGNSKQPISEEASYVKKPGHYKLKFIGTGTSGKVTTETQHLLIDLDAPSFKSSLDGKSPFIEYKPGQKTYPFDIQITDPTIDELKKLGVNIDQSSNSMVYYWGQGGFPSTPIPMDKEGKFVEEIALDESIPALQFRMNGYDMAGNKPATKQYYFVKEGTPVAYAIGEKYEVKTGDTVKATLSLDNLNAVSKAEWNFNGDGGYDRGLDSVELVDAKLHSEFSDKASLTIKDKVVTVQFNEESKALDHSKVVEVTLKVQDDQYTLGAAINPTVSVMNANNQTSSVLDAGYIWKVNPQFSMARGYVSPQGFKNEDGTVTEKRDWSKVGGTVKIFDSEGNEFDATSTVEDDGQYVFNKLPLSTNAFTIEMKAPGHFVTKEKLNSGIGFEHNGELYGQNRWIPALDITAGDVNQDHVIDVLDAIEIQNAWKTKKRAADITFDGVVDAKDMKYVQTNYLKQNEHVDNAPKPKKKYKGKTLESILVELGIQP
ncbi:S8 family serine peptidase [Peribacillus frigoritolerans]|uniref:S8 family serine peptidase n=1 Tax=Peribacillus frigoritolerans TaxID=450367 RepID=UPI002E21A20F|nr:S8 family serine peptidase [Peribacillus frigoritolerans]MED3893290.1 S8 family serine peptidase [Peribacillus frigoritolerans]